MTISEELFHKTVAAAYDLHRHRDSTTYHAWLVRVVAQTVRCDSALLVTVDVARLVRRSARKIVGIRR